LDITVAFVRRWSVKKSPPAPVAQWIEHRIPNPGAAGPIPAGGTNKNKGLTKMINWLTPFFFVFCSIYIWHFLLSFHIN
jgi:hypothetical protein